MKVNRCFSRSILFLGVICFLCGNVAAGQEILDLIERRGETIKKSLIIKVQDSLSNVEELPISIFKGRGTGPVFTIVAGVHGFEYPPIIAVQELMDEIELNKLAGTIIFIPIANSGSFYGRSPFVNPKDNINLNNAFPGDTNGTVSQQIAFKISNEVIPLTDVFLDIHGGDAPEDLIPFTCYYENKGKSAQTGLAQRLSRAAGFPYVVSYPYTISDDEPAKYAFKQAVQAGKIGLSIECGKLGNVHGEAVALIKTGVYNMLYEMKMYGKPGSNKRKFIELNRQTYVRSKEKGIFYSSFQAGDTVEEGELLGYTTDVFGTVLTEYVATATGIILYKIGTPPINKGETVMCIGSNFND